MRLVCLLVLLVGCALPSSAAAQAWQDAYNARDYDKAAVLLHEIVTDHDFALTGHDPLPAKDGRYEFAGIPIGTASITVVTPFGFRTDAGRKVEVKDLRACVAADFRMEAESAAHGIVVDQMGRPVAGVSVEAVAEELAGYWPKAIHSSVKTDHQGRFSFDRLPPGSYVFGISITSGPNGPPSGPSTFLPGTLAAKESPVFDLKPGDRLDVGSIRRANR